MGYIVDYPVDMDLKFIIISYSFSLNFKLLYLKNCNSTRKIL